MSDIKLYQHADYKARIDEWILSRKLYEANPHELRARDILVPHLFEEASEEGKNFLRPIRERRTHYTNLKEPIVSAFTTLFFRNDPDVSEVAAAFGDAIHNVDGENRSLVTFIKETLFVSYFLYGRAFIVTDTPDLEVRTRADEQASGVRPRWLGLSALAVPDWYRGAAGFKLLRYEYEEDNARTDLTEEPGTALKSKRYALDGGIVRVKEFEHVKTEQGASWRAGEEVQVRIDEIPVAYVSGRSWTKDIDPLLQRLYNLESGLDSKILHQCYQRVFIIGDVDSKRLEKSGEYVISILPAGSSISVVPPADTGPDERRIAATSSQIYRIAFNQSRAITADSRAVEGEGSAEERKDELVSLIKSEIEQIEKCVNDAVRHWAKLGGKTRELGAGRVKFSRDITRDDVNKAMESLAFLRDYLPKYPTWEKATLKKVAKAQGLPEYEDISKEIDTGPVAVSTPAAGAAARLEAALDGE